MCRVCLYERAISCARVRVCLFGCVCVHKIDPISEDNNNLPVNVIDARVAFE
jgi:hypothetical protein